MAFQTDPGLCSWRDPGSAIGMATATDDCPHPIRISNNAPGTFPKGSTQVTWTATDGSGNSAFAVQTITVVDKEAPVISSCPADVEVEGDPQNEGRIPDLVSQLIASDNCTLPGNLVVVQSPAGGSIVGVGTHVVTFTVTDSRGHSTSVTRVSDQMGAANVMFPGYSELWSAEPGEYVWTAMVQGVKVGAGSFYYSRTSVTVHEPPTL